MALLIELKDLESALIPRCSQEAGAIDIQAKHTRVGQGEGFIHDGVGFGGASHSIEDGGFGGYGGKVLDAERGPSERFVDGLIRPHERLFKIDFVVGAELGSGLPVLVVEAGPAQK